MIHKRGVLIRTDMLAEQRNNLSPYNYCSGNPVNRTDPTGMLDGWYNDENNKPAFDKNINSQADMDKAGISGTFLGAEAMVFDNADNTMKWGNKDGSLSGINLPEVAVSAERGNSNAQGGGVDWGGVGNGAFYTEQTLGTVGWAASSSANLGFKYAYRGMAEAEAAAAKTLGAISKTTTILAHGAAFAGIAAAGLQFANSNQTGADYARLGGAAIVTGTAFIPFVGLPLSIGLGLLDSYGAFDPLYNSFNTQPTLNPGKR